MNPTEEFFRRYETHLAEIVSRYPEGTTVYCAGRSPSTIRQSLQRALRIYIAHPHFVSVIPYDTAKLVHQRFVFSSNPDSTIYIGPRRLRGMNNPITIGTDPTSSPTSLTIDCSDPRTLEAILHLKNYDHIHLPINLQNFKLPPNFDHANYPNIEIVTNLDGTHTLV